MCQRIRAFPLLAIGLLLFLLCAACPSEKKDQPESRFKAHPECSKPSADCWKDCFRRDANKYCTSCCDDQTILCLEGKNYDLEKCKREP